MAKKDIRVAIIGTGGMANLHVSRFREVPGCKIVAAADIDPGRVNAFCEKYTIPQAYTSVKELLCREAVDAVTIATPDPSHAALSIQCLRAGKHVLCEKPLAMNYGEARRMVAAARKAGVIHMVNFTYRDWPCLQAVAGLIAKGDIGEIRHVEASYQQAWLVSPIWGDWRTAPFLLWRLSTRHGSKGVLGDVGVHIVDFAAFPVGPVSSVYCRLKAFPKAPRNRIGEYRLDANDSAVVNVEFANGAIGVIHTTRWCAGHPNRLHLKISGTKGAVDIDSDRSIETYRICCGEDLDKAVWKEMSAPPTPTNHQRFIKGIRTGRNEQPDFARGAEIQKVLDACFVSDAKQRPVRVQEVRS